MMLIFIVLFWIWSCILLLLFVLYIFVITIIYLFMFFSSLCRHSLSFCDLCVIGADMEGEKVR